MAGRCAMTTLRKAVDEYLTMRRNLGFQLHDAGVGLLRFVTFMEKHRASYITQQLALKWAQQPSTVQPAEWARRLSFVRTFARYRIATDRKSTRLNSSHLVISYAVFCLKKKKHLK